MIEWSGDERQRAGPLTMRDLEDHIDERIRYRLAEHSIDEQKALKERFDELKALLMSAFPAGPAKHAEYHQEQIDFMRERRELWRSLREKSLGGLMWAGIVAVGSALWHYLRAKLGAP